MAEQIEYEPERPDERCYTCEHWEYDDWYPCERVCANKYCQNYGLTKDAYDRCDWWEERRDT